MRITRINYFTLLLRLVFVAIMLLFVVVVPLMPTGNPWVIPIIIAIFLLLIFSFLRSTLLDTISIRFQDNHIEISRFLGYKKQIIKFEDIQGFSDSEIEFGRFPTKVSSVILYTDDNQSFELIKYNYLNFRMIREKLECFSYLGFEPYQTGWAFRKYKFLKYRN